MEDIEDQSVLDVGMIINAQKVEHYEIAGYGSLVALAKRLGHNDAAQLLEQTLNEEEGDRPEAEPGGAQRRQPFDLLRRPGRRQQAAERRCARRAAAPGPDRLQPAQNGTGARFTRGAGSRRRVRPAA